MKRFSIVAVALCVSITQCACAVVPPLEPISKREQKHNAGSGRILKVTLSEAIARFAPPNFAFDPDSSVDFSTVVQFDTAMPWAAAFEKALDQAGIDRDALRVAANTAPAAAQGPGAALDAASSKSQPGVIAEVAEASMPKVDSVSRSGQVSSISFASASVDPQSGVQQVAIESCNRGGMTAALDSQVWEVKEKVTLRQTLQEWNKISGWGLSWNFKDEQTGEVSDLELGGGTKCRGSYSDAVRALLAAIPESVSIYGELVPANAPPLLRIFNHPEEAL